MIVVAYQTLEDRDNIDQIEMDGPFVCNRTDAWLGNGYYFWDTNKEWAITWGERSYKDFKKEYVIARCRIDISKNCFDLYGSVKHQQDLIETIKVMMESGLIQEGHKFILPNIIQYLREKGLFPFKSIRASDEHDKKVQIFFRPNRSNFMVINQRVQICVIEKKDVILRPFSVIYPEKYLD